jgi:Ca2+-binding EF-hand superfamily protein
MMAVFSHRTDPEIKMTWAFAIWDFDGDDVIGPGEVLRSGAATTTEPPSTRLLVRLPSRDKESSRAIIQLDADRNLRQQVVDASRTFCEHSISQL